MSNKPILVSGMIRSGTTWAGKMLALDQSVNYIHEPFTYYAGYKEPHNPFFLDLDLWRGKKFEKDVRNYMLNRVSFRPIGLLYELWKSKNSRKAKLALKQSFQSLQKKRPLFKDPTAVMSSLWFENEFDSDVVITVRHPAAVINSMIAKGWGFDPTPLLRQPELVDRYLSEFKSEVLNFKTENSDIVDQGILGWNLIYARVADYVDKYPHWHIVKHETISWDPVSEFEKLFNSLSLNFTDEIRQHIIDHSQSEEISEFKRDSRDNITAWKRKLSADQIARIKEGTRSVWQKFYSEDDW